MTMIAIQVMGGDYSIHKGASLDEVLERDTVVVYATDPSLNIGWVRCSSGRLRRCSQDQAKAAASLALKQAEQDRLAGLSDPFKGDDPFWYDYVPDTNT